MKSVYRICILFFLVILSVSCGTSPKTFDQLLDLRAQPIQAEDEEFEYFPSFTTVNASTISSENEARVVFNQYIATRDMGNINDWENITKSPHYFYIRHKTHIHTVVYVRKGGKYIRYYTQRP